MSALTTHNPKATANPIAGTFAGPALHDITITGVVGMLPVATVQPGTGSILGLVSFRGKTVPVIDLRMDLIVLPLPMEEQICILAGETRQHMPVLFGALVDSEAAAYELVLSTTH